MPGQARLCFCSCLTAALDSLILELEGTLIGRLFGVVALAAEVADWFTKAALLSFKSSLDLETGSRVEKLIGSRLPPLGDVARLSCETERHQESVKVVTACYNEGRPICQTVKTTLCWGYKLGFCLPLLLKKTK